MLLVINKKLYIIQLIARVPAPIGYQLSLGASKSNISRQFTSVVDRGEWKVEFEEETMQMKNLSLGKPNDENNESKITAAHNCTDGHGVLL